MRHTSLAVSVDYVWTASGGSELEESTCAALLGTRVSVPPGISVPPGGKRGEVYDPLPGIMFVIESRDNNTSRFEGDRVLRRENDVVARVS